MPHIAVICWDYKVKCYISQDQVTNSGSIMPD